MSLVRPTSWARSRKLPGVDQTPSSRRQRISTSSESIDAGAKIDLRLERAADALVANGEPQRILFLRAGAHAALDLGFEQARAAAAAPRFPARRPWPCAARPSGVSSLRGQ